MACGESSGTPILFSGLAVVRQKQMKFRPSWAGDDKVL
jgi:hypothetical protein